MDKDYSEMASLRVRHRVQTQHIVQVNGCLSSFQKERLKSTPFKWLVDLVDDMVISSPILIELISRWDVVHKAFRIRENLVPFRVDEGPSKAAGPSTADKMNDLAIVNFVDVGMEGACRQDNIDFRSVYTTCTSSLCHDGDVTPVNDYPREIANLYRKSNTGVPVVRDGGW
ncbi:hypothetical protein LR48_Vigan11g031500 [Vigna angularis]|uniref:Uncharacterized protein n=1 Tax=Phaseolus angularis TaxID=3914 RepID=A0A0L9VQQ2_PHAAN|nr:hypothetical protein LR48_Vigan11g031500 [Vigna angularis]